jgi:hypothetical protein
VSAGVAARLGLVDEQGDRVVAPGSTGRRLLVEDDHGASGGTPILSSPIAWWRASVPVVLSQGAHAPMDIPVGRVRSATLGTINRCSTAAAGLRSLSRLRASARTARSRVVPSRRVTSASGDARTSQKAMARTSRRSQDGAFAGDRSDTCRVGVGVRANEHQAARGWLSPVSFTGGVEIAPCAAGRSEPAPTPGGLAGGRAGAIVGGCHRRASFPRGPSP